MRKCRSPYDARIAKTLSERGPLGFSALMAATQAPSNQTLSRNLRRMLREERIEREVWPTFPPKVTYRIVDRAETKPGDLAG